MSLSERIYEAARTFRDAEAAFYNALAESARLGFLEYADKHREVVGFEFELNSEYDDEGGYYDYATIRLECRPGTCDKRRDELDDDWELSDLMREHGNEAVALLCGELPGTRYGHVTVEQARERSF